MNLDDDPIAKISKVIYSRKKLGTRVRGDFQVQAELVGRLLARRVPDAMQVHYEV